MRREDWPITVDPQLFFQMLNQVSDGTNATTANFANKLGRLLDPDEGPIILNQGPPILKEHTKVYRQPRTPSGHIPR